MCEYTFRGNIVFCLPKSASSKTTKGTKCKFQRPYKIELVYIHGSFMVMGTPNTCPLPLIFCLCHNIQGHIRRHLTCIYPCVMCLQRRHFFFQFIKKKKKRIVHVDGWATFFFFFNTNHFSYFCISLHTTLIMICLVVDLYIYLFLTFGYFIRKVKLIHTKF